MVAQGDFRPSWHHLAARAFGWGGARWACEKLARRYRLDFSNQRRLPSLRSAGGPRILILCYHRIGTGGIPFHSELPTQLFERQMRFLRKHYRVLSLADACKELKSGSWTQPSVVVTFDDGYGDLFRQAMPALKRYGIPATVYLTVGAIETGEVAWYDRIFLVLKHAAGPELECELADGQSSHFQLHDANARFRAAVDIITALRTLPDSERQELCAYLEKRAQLPAAELKDRMLTWEQVRAMHDAGISFGCHTMTHPVVSRLSFHELKRELSDSRQLMEKRTGAPVLDFAYPFGKPADCGNEAQLVLEKEGYRSAVTTTGGVNVRGTNLYQLLRVNPGDERSLAMFSMQVNWHFLRASPLPGCFGRGDVSGADETSRRDTQEVVR